MKTHRIKKFITEEIKQMLSEVTYHSAIQNLNSKKTIKVIANYLKSKDINQENDHEEWNHQVNFFKDAIKTTISLVTPTDITESQRGATVLWLLRQLRNLGYPTWSSFFDDVSRRRNFKNYLETFWHWQRFMSEKDLNRISLEQLTQIVDEARSKIKEYQERQSYLDVKEGTEVLFDGDNWFIAAIHNKGAACELGKGTDWCTAAPGLNFFEQYYKPDDPLFYFLNKETGEKYQFHFGSRQFMDANDHPVDTKTKKMLLSKLIYNTDAYKKYEEIKEEIDNYRLLSFTGYFLRILKKRTKEDIRSLEDYKKSAVQIYSKIQETEKSENRKILTQIYNDKISDIDDIQKRICLIKSILEDMPHISKYKNTFIDKELTRPRERMYAWYRKTLDEYEETLINEIDEATKFAKKFPGHENSYIEYFEEKIEEIKQMLDIEIEC